MRRKEREVTDLHELLTMMERNTVCRLALFDDTYPYIVPMNYGVHKSEESFTLYVHCAKVGTKIDLIKKNPNVSFEINGGHELVLDPVSCDCTMKYESICGSGVVRFAKDFEKLDGLTHIMNHYNPGGIHDFHEKWVNAVEVLIIEVKKITGKKHI